MSFSLCPCVSVLSSLLVCMTSTTLIRRASLFVAIHAEAHFESGLMNPSIRFSELFVTGGTGHRGMICVAKNNVRRNSIDTDPLNLRRNVLIGMAFFALQRSRKLFQIGSDMASRTGNPFLNVLSVGKIQWLTNRRSPSEVEKRYKQNGNA